jgi:hypothetical protein
MDSHLSANNSICTLHVQYFWKWQFEILGISNKQHLNAACSPCGSNQLCYSALLKLVKTNRVTWIAREALGCGAPAQVVNMFREDWRLLETQRSFVIR